MTDKTKQVKQSQTKLLVSLRLAVKKIQGNLCFASVARKAAATFYAPNREKFRNFLFLNFIIYR